MMYLLGSASVPQVAQAKEQIDSVGMLLSPASWRTPHCPYACDNDVFTNWQKGRVWGQEMHCAWLEMLDKIPADNPPMWILLPDAVADWPRTVELASLYLPVLRQRGLPVALALQDRCDFEQVADFSPNWVFVAGSTEWKEANMHAICDYFKPRGIPVHVGRVNTMRRIWLCMSAGADSCDGTTLNKFPEKNLPRLARALKQSCLLI